MLEFSASRVPLYLFAALVGVSSYVLTRLIERRIPGFAVAPGLMCLLLAAALMLRPQANIWLLRYAAAFAVALLFGAACYSRIHRNSLMYSLTQLGFALGIATVVVIVSQVVYSLASPGRTASVPPIEFLTTPFAIFGVPLILHIARDLHRAHWRGAAFEK